MRFIAPRKERVKPAENKEVVDQLEVSKLIILRP